MKFSMFKLLVNKNSGFSEATEADFRYVMSVAPRTYKKNNNLYVVEMVIVEDRFFWMSCDYDNSERFRDYVVNLDTQEKEPNPRTKIQIEPRQQFFACYDLQTKALYLNNLDRRSFLQKYFSEATSAEYIIQNVYANVDEFCQRVKEITGFRFVQIDNLYSHSGNLFKQIGNLFGEDSPKEIQMKVSYVGLPMHAGGRGVVDLLHRNKDQFENVIIVGRDQDDVEHSFDFSSVLKNIQIHPTKDNNAQYDPTEVRSLLLAQLR